MFGNPIFNNIIQQVKENAIKEADAKAKGQKEKASDLLKEQETHKYKSLHEEGLKKMTEKGKINEGNVPAPVFTTTID